MNIRILGLVSNISFMSIMLLTWSYANAQGYVYFAAGEPLLYIKYSEWVLAVMGIWTAWRYLKKELSSADY